MKERLIILAIAMVLIIGILPYDIVRANEDINLLEGRTRPKVIRTRPSNRERYFDSGRLMRRFSDPDEEGYYIEIVFEDIDDNLLLVNSLPGVISLNVEGETGNNLVDKNKSIRFTRTSKELSLYIPLLDRPKDGQIYNLTIDEDSLVKYKDGEEEGNNSYEFTFETNYLPKTDRLYQGTLPEFYDHNYPIVIDGSSFHRETRVRFRGMDGRSYNADSITMDRDNKTLYVYLPRYPKLPIGLYDIIISNGRNYDVEMKHGVLSVVKQGDYVPNEEYRVKEENDIGMVKEIIGTSKDVIELNKKNTNKSKVEIDLDELMGSEVWVRSIEYPTDWSDSINELILSSKWTNVNIRNLKLHEDSDEKQIELRVGRVEPAMGDLLKGRIVNRNIKSNFIEVSGGNFDFDKITIEIPYFESDGKALKMLRYDENMRAFEEITSTIDQVDGKIIGSSQGPGIFVIVD